MQTLSLERLSAAFFLAAIAGCVDAVGFSELGGYFVSFMSGNSTRFGLHIAAGDWSLALFTLGLIALFVGGVAAGTLIAGQARGWAPAAILLTEAALLAVAARLLVGPHPLRGVVLLPVAMGLSNAFLLRDGVRIGLTYMTGTLVRIGIGLAALGSGEGRARALLLDMMLWLALVTGVVIGGIGYAHYRGGVLLGPAVALAVIGVVETLVNRRRTA